jgi:hypothetical protein
MLSQNRSPSKRKDDVLPKLAFKIKKSVKSKIRKLSKTRSRSPASTEVIHALKSRSPSPAKNLNAKKTHTKDYEFPIKPKISLLPIDDLVFKGFSIGIRLLMSLLILSGIFSGWIISQGFSMMIDTSFCRIFWGFNMVLAGIGLFFGSIILIKYLKDYDTIFSSSVSCRIKKSGLASLHGMSNESMEEVFNRLPWRLRELGVDSFTWGNDLIASVFPSVARTVYARIKKTVDGDNAIRNIFNKHGVKVHLIIDRLSLGSQIPKLEGIKVLNDTVSRNEDLIIQSEIDFEFDGVVSLRLQVEYGEWKRDFPMGLDNLRLRIKSEIIAAPLLPRLPAVGGITFRLMEPPALQINLSGCLSILNLLGSVVTSVLSQVLFYLTKSPHPIHVNISNL